MSGQKYVFDGDSKKIMFWGEILYFGKSYALMKQFYKKGVLSDLREEFYFAPKWYIQKMNWKLGEVKELEWKTYRTFEGGISLISSFSDTYSKKLP